MKRSGLRRPTLEEVQAWDRKPRKPISRGRKAIARMSARRLSEREERELVVAKVRKRDRTCQAGAVHALAGVPCAGPLDVHEIIPRSGWRVGYLEPTNCVLVCRSAHDWIGTHPHGACALGLHGFSWERPR